MGAPFRENEYLRFVMWCALPSKIRSPKTQGELAEQLGVHETTLSDWKRKEDYPDLVRKFIKEWARDRTSDVVDAIYQGAISVGDKGQAANAKLWLQWVDEWAESADVNVYDVNREARAKSLLEVYEKFNNEADKTKAAKRKRAANKSDNRNTKAKKAKTNK